MTEIDLVHADEQDVPPVAGDAEGPDAAEAADGGEAAGAEEAVDAEAELETVSGDAGEVPEAGSARPERGPGEELDDETLVQHAAALLFASPDPLSTDRLVQLLERPSKLRVRAALTALQQRFEDGRLPLQLTEIAGGWRVLSHADLGDVVQRLAKVRKAEKVTPAALETLSIVAYRQPVTTAEVEAIRGVQSGAMLRMLVDRGLVRVTGRADQPGSPLQYGTTKDFLDRFGLASLKDLPRDGELAKS